MCNDVEVNNQQKNLGMIYFNVKGVDTYHKFSSETSLQL